MSLCLGFFPLPAGIFSLALYWMLLKRWTNQITGFVALSFFAFMGPCIIYSAECKQYSVEVLSTIVLYLSAHHFQSRPAGTLRILFFGLIGMVCILFSHTAIFILAGIGITQGFYLFNKEERPKNIGYLYTYAAWAICFIFIYIIYLKSMIAQDAPTATAYFMPSKVFLKEGGIWLWRSTAMFFNYLQLRPNILAISVSLMGGIYIFRSDKRKFFMLILPLILAISASGLKKFPFHGRFILFLTPIILLFMSQGIRMLMGKSMIAKFLGVAVFAILFLAPFKTAISNEIHPRGNEETRPLIGYLNKHQKPGDLLFLNNESQHAYSYYSLYFGMLPSIQGILF